MVRLPIPGSDDGKWGEILNQYLGVSLGADGKLKQDSVGRDQLQADAVTGHTIANNSIETAHLTDGLVTSDKLASGVLSKSAVGLGNVDNTSDIDKPISSATQTALDAKITGPDGATANSLATFDGVSGRLLASATSATVAASGELSVTGVTVVKTSASASQLYNRTDGAAAVFGAGFTQSVFSFDEAYPLEIRSAPRSSIENKTLNQGSVRLKIDGTSGNVGIGTMTAPSAKLDVDGNAKVSGTVTVGGVQQANVYAGTAAPVSPVVGQVWIDTSGI